MNLLERVERTEIKKARKASFRPGDTVKVHVKVVEGGKERVQVFEGIVLARKGGGLSETFTVRKISAGIGVERVFPMQSPVVKKVQVVRRGKARRAKLYFLRGRVGKRAKVAELAKAQAAKDKDVEAFGAEAAPVPETVQAEAAEANEE